MLRGVAEIKLWAAARTFRAFHGLVAVAFLLAIAYVWWCALTGRRDKWLRVAVAALATEGAVVVANHGDCRLARSKTVYMTRCRSSSLCSHQPPLAVQSRS